MPGRFFVFAVVLSVSMFLAGCLEPQAPSGPAPQTKAVESAVNRTEPAPAEVNEPAPSPAVEPAAQPAEAPKGQPAAEEPNDANKVSAQPAEQNIVQPKPLKPEYEPATDFHDKCATILKTYVNEKGIVDYKTLSRKRVELLNVLDEFKKLDRARYERWSPQDKTAFWINAYNLQLMRIILENYPIQSTRVLRLIWPPNSIRHIKGIWSEYKFIIMDEEFTLKELDTRFLQDQADDPRVFFVMSYACMSSGPLRNEPYRGENLPQQFDEQVRRSLAGGHWLKIDREAGKVYLSAMLKSTWYGDRFIKQFETDKKFKEQEPAVQAVLNFLLNYVPASDATYLETGNYTVDYLSYDWTLNE